MLKKSSLAIIACLTLIFCGVGLVSAGDYYSEIIKPQQYEGTTYMSGGFGKDERRALQAMGRNFSLKLIFAAQGGDYLSAVKVLIKDKRGETWLEAVSQGPWFYAKLPRGRFTVQVAFKNRSFTKTVTVNPPKQSRLRFYWKM